MIDILHHILESTRVRIERSPVDLNAVIRDVLAVSAPGLPPRSIGLATDLPQDSLCSCRRGSTDSSRRSSLTHSPERDSGHATGEESWPDLHPIHPKRGEQRHARGGWNT